MKKALEIHQFVSSCDFMDEQSFNSNSFMQFYCSSCSDLDTFWTNEALIQTVSCDFMDSDKRPTVLMRIISSIQNWYFDFRIWFWGFNLTPLTRFSWVFLIDKMFFDSWIHYFNSWTNQRVYQRQWYIKLDSCLKVN